MIFFRKRGYETRTKEFIIKQIPRTAIPVELFVLMILITSFQSLLASHSGVILSVNRELKLNHKDTPPPKEYYVSLGEQDGISEGSVINVMRNVPVTEERAGEVGHLIQIPLGEIKIFHVGEFVSLGQVHSIKDKTMLPALDYPVFMIGDIVETKSSLPFD